MTKLEEEIFKKIYEWSVVTDDEGQPVDFHGLAVHHANIAGEVAKKYIQKAIIELSDMNTERIDTNEWREKWLKENGIV